MSDKLSDYDFDFDESRIALRPILPRGDAALLYFDGEVKDLNVRDYADILTENDMLIFNDTKVLPARLDGQRFRNSAQGRVSAQISVTLLAPLGENGMWQCMIKPMRKVELGEVVHFGDGFEAVLKDKQDGMVHLQFEVEGFSEKLAEFGRMPLPPYIEGKRRADAQDLDDYQPYLARIEGAVAAPTASLHFDEVLMGVLAAKGVKHETITLHVGAGTFLPVKVDDVTAHKMHSERGEILSEVAERINAHRANGGRVIAVGTTSARLLESAAKHGSLSAYNGSTDIFIRPGYAFQIVDGLITNFHLPKSTLLMLVAAFVGFDEMHQIYQHALTKNYRFFSYGDSSFLRRT